MSNLPPNSANTNKRDQATDSTIEELAANADQMELPKGEKKAARWAFHLFNFFGLHVAFNSTVSLLITYNLLPTKPAQALKETLGNIATPVNKWLYKLTTPIKKLIQGSAFKEISKEQMAINVAHSARSRVETAFMCIAGFLALWPVKYLEDHRAGFINAVDNFFHPGRSKEERKAVALKPEDEPKETWVNLIRARFVGLGVVFAADALQQRLNNWMGYEKGNIDTAVWKWGANVSEKMHQGWRNGIVNFFSRKGINLTGIQPEMRSHLLTSINSPKELRDFSDSLGKIQAKMGQTLDKSVTEGLKKEIETANKVFQAKNPKLVSQMERAIFAEQSRLLITKEIFLTLLISATIYTAAKAPFMARLFEKIGLKKKEHHETKESEANPAPQPTKSGDDVTPLASAEKLHEKRFSQHSVKPAADWQTSVNNSGKESATQLSI